MYMIYKTIKVSPTTYQKIAQLGNLSDTFDTVLDRIVTQIVKNQGEAPKPS